MNNRFTSQPTFNLEKIGRRRIKANVTRIYSLITYRRVVDSQLNFATCYCCGIFEWIINISVVVSYPSSVFRKHKCTARGDFRSSARQKRCA